MMSGMAYEAKTQLRWDGRILDGTALLEPGALTFRGGASVTVPFSEMWQVEANAGWLELKTARGLLLLELGPKADVWREKIKNPGDLAQKLGVDADKRVVIVGKLDAGLRQEIEASGAKVAKSARGKDFDVAFVAARSAKDVEGVAKARALIREAGALWVVFPGAKEALTERDVFTAGRTRGLLDNKKLKIDDELVAVRFVVPPSGRKKR